jgi:hypothetical protein
MSLSKINCPGDFCNLVLYDVVVFHVYVQRNCPCLFSVQ